MKKSIFLLLFAWTLSAGAAERPNIVWIFAEDLSTELECYGEPGLRTPNLNALAAKGARYTRAFTTAPSCTPSRNAMLTGVYQTRTDTQDQRRKPKNFPRHIKPFPILLKEAGYYTALGCGYSTKTDHSFGLSQDDMFDSRDWSGRASGQPFFAQITIYETHRLKAGRWEELSESLPKPVDPSDIELPPYFPDTPVTRKDWALYLDSIQWMDREVGKIMQRLKGEGIADNTLVIFSGDNGACHLRGKCWLYDQGLLVPLILRWPGKIEPGMVNGDLVSMIDITATILDVAGVDLPDYLDGHPILGPKARKRDRIFGARDQVDEVMDHIRCVRDKRYKYIRNYTPENGYRESRYVYNHRPMWPEIKKLAADGALSETQMLLLQKTKPLEELYDLEEDPWEINNLAESPENQETKARLAALLDGWIADTEDKGLDNLEYDRKNIIRPRKKKP